MFAVGIAINAEVAAATEAHVRVVHEALAPWEAERTYFNFTERRADGRTLWGELTYRRLRDVKARYDAGNLFRSNHPIEPALRETAT